MRDIKYRGKRADNGEWVCGFYYSECNCHYIIENRQIKSMSHRNITYLAIPETVGESLGRMDKNGVEVFEGDILKCMLGIGHVMYAEDLTGFIVVYKKTEYEKYSKDVTVASRFFSIDGGCEVIGNIHDNPELINQGQQ